MISLKVRPTKAKLKLTFKIQGYLNQVKVAFGVLRNENRGDLILKFVNRLRLNIIIYSQLCLLFYECWVESFTRTLCSWSQKNPKSCTWTQTCINKFVALCYDKHIIWPLISRNLIQTNPLLQHKTSDLIKQFCAYKSATVWLIQKKKKP